MQIPAQLLSKKVRGILLVFWFLDGWRAWLASTWFEWRVIMSQSRMVLEARPDVSGVTIYSDQRDLIDLLYLYR
jgi:hypothetical protein